ncbi:MAG: hypothetical protein ACK4FA_00480 [Candidatus Paceibacteria bacterium]
MKNLILLPLLLILSQNTFAQQKYEDKTPQSAVSAEYSLWYNIINQFDYVATDSSFGNTVREIASFDGIKMQLRRGTGNLAVINAWEYRSIKSEHGSLFLYIFHIEKNKKEIISLRPIDGYKKVRLFLSPHNAEQSKLDAYIPNNVANKEITRIELKF